MAVVAQSRARVRSVARTVKPTLAIRSIYYLTAFGSIVLGAGFAFGPDVWTASAAYTVIKQIFPIETWGWLFILVGVVKMMLGHRTERCYRIGSAMGGTMALALAGGFLGTAFTGDLVGWSAVVGWLMVASVQLVGAAAIWRK